jgi:hypothetical protein
MKVTIRGVRPPIWRRFQVTGDTLLWSLHGILQSVMGWDDEHPHRFLINGRYYGEPGLSTSILKVVDEESVSINQVISAEGEKFLYEYGSGTGWNHEVVIERIFTPKNGERYPICLDGDRACPPEHCSGPWNYRELLKELKDRSGPREGNGPRIGRVDFDPEDFKAEETNGRLGWT